MTKEQFANYRHLLGLSKKEMADALGWSLQQVYNVETGKRNISKTTELSIKYLMSKKG